MLPILSLIISFILGGLLGGLIVSRRGVPFREFVDEDEEIMQHAREAVTARTNKRLDKIMAAVEKAGRITNDGVEELFCISDRTASRYLRIMTKSGRLKRNGSGRNTFYTKPK